MNNDELKCLPFSNRKYFIDVYGNILNEKHLKIDTVLIKGEVFVKIDWVNGNTLYLVPILILYAYGKLTINTDMLHEVEILYEDDDALNVAPSNIYYRFKNGPLEVKWFPGFYYIPFFTDYAIDENGTVINSITGKVKSWYIAKGGNKNSTGGYLYTRVIININVSTTLGKHRALCLTFKRYNNDISSIVVNHIDGNPSNNLLSNLEWVTRQYNNIHAIENGLKINSVTPILMKDLKTNIILSFPSISACARHLKHSRESKIIGRLQQCNKVYEDLILFKKDDGSDWPEIDLSKVKITRQNTSIVARNIFTGNKLIFTGATEGYNLTGVKPDTITLHLRKNKCIPINGYNFRYLEDNIEWPIHSARHLKIYEKYPIYPPNGLISLDITNNEETFFTSVEDFCQCFNISKSKISELITDKKIFKGKYLLSYFKIRDSYGPSLE